MSLGNRPRRPPAHMQGALMTLERFPEFNRRVVDGVTKDPCSWPCAVGHVGVLEYHRGDFDLVGYSRQHGLVMTRYREILMKLLAHDNAVVTVTSADEANQSKTLTVLTHKADTTNEPFNFDVDPTALNDCAKLKYGDSSTAAAATQYDLQGTTKHSITASSITYDDTNIKAVISGSRVHSEANMTVRELALLMRFRFNVNQGDTSFHMLDRTVPTAQNIVTDQSAAITYEVSI
jgi:hypothetical protein